MKNNSSFILQKWRTSTLRQHHVW